jgi:hypothetical protein
VYAAKEIWEELHKRATEELIDECVYPAEAKSSDIKKITDYIEPGCKPNGKPQPLRFTYGTVAMVPRDIDAPNLNDKIKQLRNCIYRYVIGRKNILNHIPSIAENVWAKMRSLAENECERQGRHHVNGQKFKLKFVQSYPPNGRS